MAFMNTDTLNALLDLNIIIFLQRGFTQNKADFQSCLFIANNVMI